MALISFSRRFADHAARHPDAPALTLAERTMTWAELDAAANRTARELAALGVTEGDMVTIALPNSLEFVIMVVACWRLGAVPQPVSSRLPRRELAEIVDLAAARVVVGVDPPAAPGHYTLPAGWQVPEHLDASALPDAVSPAWKAPTSGGSTGRPKLIVSGDPSLTDDEARPALLVELDGCMVVPGPLYHNGPFVWAMTQLLAGGHLVLLARFDAAATLAAVERHRADVLYLVPTMMTRIWRMDEHDRNAYDLSSLRVVWHLAAPCPVWLKREWIEWLGPDRIVELYAGTEAQAATIITGREWLAHPGSVGRPSSGEIKVLDEAGDELPAGEVGEVFMRPAGRERPTYTYIGAEATTRPGGWESLGDMGHVDADGYLYLGDRRKDMILSGGANIYPAEVEGALDRHPQVRSSCVIGLPDDDLGSRVHAIVEVTGDLDAPSLVAFLADELVVYKIPRSFEFVSEPLRDDAGKMRRSQLAADRTPS